MAGRRTPARRIARPARCRPRTARPERAPGGLEGSGGTAGFPRRRSTGRGTRGVQLSAVGPHAVLAVTDDRVVLPAVPRAYGRVDEFMSRCIAVSMVRMGGFAEGRRGQRRDGGDDVPARPAAAEMIQRRKPAGEFPGLAVGRRAGPDQPDIAGDSGQSREHRNRVELRLRQVAWPGIRRWRCCRPGRSHPSGRAPRSARCRRSRGARERRGHRRRRPARPTRGSRSAR